MKMLALLLGLVVSGTFACNADAATRVRGYVKKDGTYVAPHYRSSPNSSRYDNYSTKGNVNPYTGKAGTQSPYSNSYSNPYGSSYSSPSRSSYDSQDSSDDSGYDQDD